MLFSQLWSHRLSAGTDDPAGVDLLEANNTLQSRDYDLMLDTVRRRRFAVVISFWSLASCVDNRAPLADADLSKAILFAINSNDSQQLLAMADTPLTVIEQAWESAATGYGFTLGEKTITSYRRSDGQSLGIWLATVTIESKEALRETFTSTDFSEEFRGDSEHWRNLTLITYLRGQGDVEHLVIVGIVPDTKRIKTIYVN